MGSAFARRSKLVVQTKLTVGRADDREEVEADRVAERVTSELGAPAHRHGGGGGRSDTLGGLAVDAGMEARINRARPSGEALDPDTRSSMETAFGHDFSEVRVHQGKESDSLNRSLQAEAFTTGNDIFFSGNAYAPGTDRGSSLVAHELAHVVQQGGVRRAMVQRAFSPKSANIDSITSALKLNGGLANKGVFLLTGEGGNELVAKFIAEDPRRAQMADIVLSMGGSNSGEAQPYGMDVGKRLTAKIRQLAQQLQQGGDPTKATILNDAANRADSEASGVVLMKKMGGTDLGDTLVGHHEQATQDEKDKAQRGGVNPLELFASGAFHRNLGTMYVADGLLGSSDRLFHDGNRGRLNSKNLKALADGTINTFDSDTVMVSYEVFRTNKSVADKSAKNWATWLIEGGNVWDLGIDAPGALTHNLMQMFDKKVRQDLFDSMLKDAKAMASALDWSNFNVDFAQFDRNFFAGMVTGLKNLVAAIDDMVKAAKDVGGEDSGGGTVDSQALAVKMEFMKSVLPDLDRGEEVGEQTKQQARANALKMAEKFVAKNLMVARAKDLSVLEPGLLPVPPRPREMGRLEKAGRAFGRKVTKLVGNEKTKNRHSKSASNLNKRSKNSGIEGLESAREGLEELKGKGGGGSHRFATAEFEINYQRSLLSIHRRANEFGNADMDIMKLQTAISDKPAVAEYLSPYLRLTNGGAYDKAVKDYKSVATGYTSQLTRKGDDGLRTDMEKAVNELDNAQQNFEAGVDYIERLLRKG